MKATAVALLALTMILPTVASAATPQATDLTASFRPSNPQIEKLQVFEVGGIVVIRGRAADRATAEAAGRYALTLGYNRVANLVQVIEAPDDAAIQRRAERALSIHRSLDGCSFQIDSDQGVVRVAGRVSHELQKDVAAQLLRNIDGVREVRLDLQR